MASEEDMVVDSVIAVATEVVVLGTEVDSVCTVRSVVGIIMMRYRAIIGLIQVTRLRLKEIPPMVQATLHLVLTILRVILKLNCLLSHI